MTKHRTVRITLDLVKAVEAFIKTEVGKSAGFDSRSDVVTAGVRSILKEYGYYKLLKRKAEKRRKELDKQDA